jgi:hypothetical protein
VGKPSHTTSSATPQPCGCTAWSVTVQTRVAMYAAVDVWELLCKVLHAVLYYYIGSFCHCWLLFACSLFFIIASFAAQSTYACWQASCAMAKKAEVKTSKKKAKPAPKVGLLDGNYEVCWLCAARKTNLLMNVCVMSGDYVHVCTRANGHTMLPALS